MADEKNLRPLGVDFPEGKVRPIRLLPKRKNNAAYHSAPLTFAGERALNPTPFNFSTLLVPSLSALPPPAISATITATEIEKLFAEKENKTVEEIEQVPAPKMDPAMIEEMLEPDAEKQDGIEVTAPMEVKNDENLDMMVGGSTPPVEDLALVAEPVAGAGSSAEAEELMMRIRALEQEKLDMRKELKRLEEVLAAATSVEVEDFEELPKLNISETPPPSPSIASPLAEEPQAEPLASVFARTADMPSDERKIELFNSQHFTEAELSEEGDIESMANLLQSLAEEFDAQREAESQSKPTPPLTRTAWREKNGLTKQPAPAPRSSNTASSRLTFSWKKLFTFLCFFMVFRTVCFSAGVCPLHIPFTTTPNPAVITTSIEPLTTSNEPIFNEPTCPTWSNGSSELNDMITCFACDEPIPEFPEISIIDNHEIVHKHDPLFPVPNSVWVGYQWTKAAWKESELYEHFFLTCNDPVFEC
ncbi:hypothetical protein BKA64DRAFT_636115 [Cadophora sp. MPI-SDFR-AT-0126]|nr:hypothetical protein BKA64DRAFT_636115 [Leotiomycetes sp. MPI-SDFR-AT-0126]